MAIGSIGSGSYNQLSMQQGINFKSQSTMIDTGNGSGGGGISIVNQNISIEINQSIDINQVFGGSDMRMGIAEDLKSMSIGQLEKETMDSIKELLDSQKLEDIKKQLELFKKLLEIQKEMLEAILKMMGAGAKPEQGKVNMEDLEQMEQSGRGKIKATEKGLTEVYEKIQEAAENEAKKEEALKNQAKGQDVNAENNNEKGDSKKLSSSEVGNMRYQASADSAEMLSMVGGGGAVGGAGGEAGGAEGGGASGGASGGSGSGGGGSAA